MSAKAAHGFTVLRALLVDSVHHVAWWTLDKFRPAQGEAVGVGAPPGRAELRWRTTAGMGWTVSYQFVRETSLTDDEREHEQG
ncbi:MAG: hypothetical protein HS111_10460 [Kofleriaceae bacterium]|nr:hypothetical protein [Kofleriaceae bacterium]